MALTDERILQILRDSDGDMTKAAAAMQREKRLDTLASAVSARAAKAINEVIEPARANPSLPIPTKAELNVVLAFPVSEV